MNNIPQKNNKQKHVLVAGGAGYIGSHTSTLLLQKGYKVTIIDNLINSSQKCIDRIKEIVGNKLSNNLSFYKVDLLNIIELNNILFSINNIDACIHFAGLKAVGESVKFPLLYYNNNLTGTFNLLNVLKKLNCNKIVFSSSATVYGKSIPPLTENSSVGIGITNPYGKTKYMLEEILKDLENSNLDLGVVILRYFNPVGAHPSGKLGESPNGIPNNLMPYIQQVAIGKREKLTIYGNDYDTHDGTGVRDYIHVQDLAEGHIAALKKLDASPNGFFTYNLGTGTGYSVLDMVKAMEKACNRKINYCIGKRRSGDLATVFCDPIKAKNELKWEAKLGLDDMCASAWKWQSTNPNGFDI
jgi:UDP-glucose 4-epimerase